MNKLGRALLDDYSYDYQYKNFESVAISKYSIRFMDPSRRNKMTSFNVLFRKYYLAPLASIHSVSKN